MRSRTSVLLVVAALSISAPGGSAFATTFAVTSTADLPDATPGDGVCATSAASCTLRAAVQEANASAGADSIELPAGTYALAPGTREDAAAAGDLDVTEDLTILGAGALETRLTSGLAGGTTAERALDVLAGTVRVVGIDIASRQHHATSGGGVLRNTGDVTFEDCLLDGWTSGGAFGGGAFNEGTLTLRRTALRGVVADPAGPESGSAIWNEGLLLVEDTSFASAGLGSALVNFGGAVLRRAHLGFLGVGRLVANEDGATLEVEDSMLLGRGGPNSIEVGGGIYNRGDAILTRTTVTRHWASTGGGIYTSTGTFVLRDSTVSANSADTGGGIDTDGRLTIVNSTISGNRGIGGAGIAIAGAGAVPGAVVLHSSTVTDNEVVSIGLPRPAGITGPATLRNTILAGNRFKTSHAPGTPVTPADCGFAPMTSEGHNLIQASTCVIQGDPTGNVLGVAPGLGPLADNGGPTHTHLPLDGSPALDAAHPAAPGGAAPACPARDQRGVDRPQGSRCDIGAAELARCGDGTIGPDETCDDGNTSGGDCCEADCRSVTVCPACERCEPPAGCVAAPFPACRSSIARFSGQLRMRTGPSDTRRRLEWKWSRGAATSVGDFGDPTNGERLTFCLFDESGSTPSVAFRSVTRANDCGATPCWRPTGASGFRYRDAAAPADGPTEVLLRAGADGQARIVLDAKGALALPSLPARLPLRAQLQTENGQCWEGRYFELDATRNSASEFRGPAFTYPTPPTP